MADVPPQPVGPAFPMPPRTSQRSVWVAVTGIGSIVGFFMCCLGIVPAIVSLCLAPGARRELATTDENLTGDGLIRAGVVCSWITIGLTVLAVIAFVLFLSAWEWSIGESIEWSST
ncbi:hypothetical protein GCM10009547_14040 [Sporichthya brevicatena]|uniref:DUF4190 domain-containing protein n=1 Tax=Sporichthya brevicatena TaxID=171442 RepID=A0ABN1GKC2_9ACTN